MADKVVLESPVFKEIELKIDGQDYILREFDEGGSVTYENARSECLHETASGKAVFRNFSNMEPLLISLCLTRINRDPQSGIMTGRVGVTQEEIRKFHPTIAEALYNHCRELCGLNKKVEEKQEETKNS